MEKMQKLKMQGKMLRLRQLPETRKHVSSQKLLLLSSSTSLGLRPLLTKTELKTKLAMESLNAIEKCFATLRDKFAFLPQNLNAIC